MMGNSLSSFVSSYEEHESLSYIESTSLSGGDMSL